MSYGFDLFELPPDMDLDTALELMGSADQNITDKEQRVQRNKAIATALIKANPNLELFENESHIELDASSNGIQIMLFLKEAGITVPYWYTEETAVGVFNEIWTYLRIIQQHTGYVIYDSQLGKLIDLDTDFQDVLEVNSTMIDHIHRDFGQGEA